MPWRPGPRLHARAMHDAKEIDRRIRALRRWVEREQRELERTGRRPTQRYLRRARVADYVAEPEFREGRCGCCERSKPGSCRACCSSAS